MRPCAALVGGFFELRRQREKAHGAVSASDAILTVVELEVFGGNFEMLCSGRAASLDQGIHCVVDRRAADNH